MVRLLRIIPILSILIFSVLIVPQARSGTIGEEAQGEGIYDEVYRVSPGDVLEIEVYEADELNKAARVSSSGLISIALVGAVDVKGLTEREVEDKLEKLLGEKFFQDPQVSVFVKEGGFFYVLGKVESEIGGKFPFTPGITLQQAIAMAGGFTRKDDADLRNIQITRDVEGGGKKVFTVDYTRITDGQLRDVPLNKGDVVFVRSLGKYFVSGYVRNPRSFDLRQNTTLHQAISAAGGIDVVGKGARVRITRVKQGGGVKNIIVNYNKVRDGKVADLSIHEDDIIYVPRSYMLSVVRSFFFSLGVGGGDRVGVTPTTLVGR